MLVPQVMLWPVEMADVTLLVLSAGDDRVPSALVQAHLQSLKSNCQVGSLAPFQSPAGKMFDTPDLRASETVRLG